MLEWWNWYTRTTQNRVPHGLRVQVPPPAPNEEIKNNCSSRTDVCWQE